MNLWSSVVASTRAAAVTTVDGMLTATGAGSLVAAGAQLAAANVRASAGVRGVRYNSHATGQTGHATFRGPGAMTNPPTVKPYFSDDWQLGTDAASDRRTRSDGMLSRRDFGRRA